MNAIKIICKNGLAQRVFVDGVEIPSVSELTVVYKPGGICMVKINIEAVSRSVEYIEEAQVNAE
jgi:hypothetical protein